MKKLKGDTKKFIDIILRYLIIVLVAFPGLWIFYFIFTPLTIYPTYLFFGLFSDVVLIGNILIINSDLAVEFIRACIAGSAYYLLLALNLSIPDVKLKKRFKMIAFAFALLLFVNLIRIITLISIYGFKYFDVTHEFFWYFVSTIFVVGIWFFEVKIFKIKQIPFYSDLKFLYKQIK